MEAQATAKILRHMHQIPDFRRHNRIHKLGDVITIAIFAVICGAEGWVEVEQYGRKKLAWLKTFLDLPNGIPAHDTLGRVFARLKPEEFERCFMAWMATLVELSGGKLVAIDAWGCNKTVVELIWEGKADYLLQVKDNQPTLHAKVQLLMDEMILENFAGIEHDNYEQTDGDHGRIETRRVWVAWNVKDRGPIAQEWPGLKSRVVVECIREVGELKSVERHYYISSLGRRTRAKRMAGYIRGHWTVENNVRWQVDISFNEDQRRIRKGHGAENFSRLCRIALNLLKNEDSLKIGIAGKRKTCGWDNKYMLQVVGQ